LSFLKEKIEFTNKQAMRVILELQNTVQTQVTKLMNTKKGA